MDAIVSHLHTQWPWLSNAKLCDGGVAFDCPNWLRLGACAITASELRPVVLVMPQNANAGRWVALVCALEKFRTGFDARVDRFCGAVPGTRSRVVVQPENRFYFYGGTSDDGQTTLHCVDGNSLSIRISRLRIRAQARGGLEGRIHSLRRHPASHSFAALLGCDPLGNQELLGEGIVLVDSKNGVKDFVSAASIAQNDIKGFLHDFDPQRRLLKVHRTALDFIDSNPTAGQTVIVNGARRLETLVDLHKLVGLHKLVVLAARDDLANLKRLEGNADFWFLEDDPWLADKQDSASIRVRNLASCDWTPKLVSNHAVERAALALGCFCRLLHDADESPAHSLAGPAWGLLLELAGRSRGFSDNQRRAFALQINQFQKVVTKAAQSLTPEMSAAVASAISLITYAAQTEKGDTNSKAVALYGLLGQGVRSAMVVRGENEGKSLRARFPAVTVFTQTELPLEDTFEQIVVCGWLGAQRMSQLLLSASSPRVVLVGYGFELIWLRSLVGRIQRREGIAGADGTAKLDIVGAPDSLTEWPFPQSQLAIKHWPEAPALNATAVDRSPNEPTWDEIDIWRFECEVKQHRKESVTARCSGTAVEQVPVRYVSFSGPGYAYLTPDRSLPVVTELLREGEKSVRSCRVLDLRDGDLVLFPQIAGSDLITEIADKLLSDRADILRNKAGQYALQLQSSRLTAEEFRAKAMKLGLNRSLATVRQWFSGSRVIGPDTDEDIKIIQQVVGGTNWASQCIEARQLLKQAHSAAESILRKALVQKIEQNLDEIEACGCRLELGEIGAVWVQRVDAISDHAEVKPRSRINRLLGVE